MQRTLLALALILTAGASYAQTMQTNEPRDPYGRPFIGRSDWVRQPGDEPGTRAGTSMQSSVTVNNGSTVTTVHNSSDMAAAPTMPSTLPARSGPHQTAFKDEYGFRYDAQGNRLDARGNIISPHTR